MKRDTSRRPCGATRPLTADKHRALIQECVDQARADQRIAELLAAEARLRFGPESDVPKESK